MFDRVMYIVLMVFFLSGCFSAEDKQLLQPTMPKYPLNTAKNADYSRFNDKSHIYRDALDLKKFKIDAPAKNIASWRVTHQLRGVRFSGNSITFDTAAVDSWRSGDPLKTGRGDLVGNAWIVDVQTGKASTWEWMRKGQKTKSLHNINKILKPGRTYGFFLSTFARNHMRSTNERTNVVVVRV